MTDNVHKLHEEGGISFGQMLRHELIRLGLAQQDLATKLKVSRATINNLINNKYPVSPKVAEGLEEIFDRPHDFWRRRAYTEADLPHVSSMASESAVGGSELGRLSNEQISAYLDAGHVTISPRNDINIQPASVDLTAGKTVVTTDGTVINITTKPFLLAPKTAVRITTLEKITLPHFIAGNIGGMARHARKFIFYGIGYEIDPGFGGHLEFTIVNHGALPFRLSAGMPIITVMLYQLARGSTTSHAKREQDNRKRRPLSETIEQKIRQSVTSSFIESREGTRMDYTLEGTSLTMQTQVDLDKGALFECFLNEVAHIRTSVDGHNGADGESNNTEHNPLWTYIDSIELPLQNFMDQEARLQPIIASSDADQIDNWRHQTALKKVNSVTTLGDQADIIGSDSITILLALFDRVRRAKDGELSYLS